MQKRTLGKSRLEVSALGFGCMGLNFGYTTAITRQDAVKLIRVAFDKGVTFFDATEEVFSMSRQGQKALIPFKIRNRQQNSPRNAIDYRNTLIS